VNCLIIIIIIIITKNFELNAVVRSLRHFYIKLLCSVRVLDLGLSTCFILFYFIFVLFCFFSVLSCVFVLFCVLFVLLCWLGNWHLCC
jgi:hypothetical protein